MELTVDRDKYETLQVGLASQLAMAVHRGLAHLKLPEKDLKDAVTTVVFNVCNVVDGTAVVEVDGAELVPFLMFEESEGSGRLVTCGHASFMHEYAHGVVDSYFNEQA